jgi:streptogramin lyase
VWFSADGPPPGVGFITPTGTVHEFGQDNGLDPGNPGLAYITAGPDGNMWFTDFGEGNTEPPAIGRVTPAGAITEFPMASGSDPQEIVSGPQSRLWFADHAGAGTVDSVTTAGSISEDTDPGKFVGDPTGLMKAPSGILYFGACLPAIGHVLLDGSVSQNPGTTCSGAHPVQIAVGGDGNLWWIEQGSGDINESPQYPNDGGVIHSFALPHHPGSLVAGPDGNLWYTTDFPGAIGRIIPPPAGSPPGTPPDVKEFSAGLNAQSIPLDLAAGPDGNVYFSDGACSVNHTPSGLQVMGWCAIGQITPSGVITEFPIGSGVALPYTAVDFCFNCSTEPGKIIAGPDGNIWYIENGDPPGIGRLVIPGAAGPPPGGPPPGGGVASVPKLSSVHESAKIWRLGTKLPTITSLPVGTTFSFTLDKAATVTFKFGHRRTGRKVKRRCAAPSPKNGHKPKCTRTVRAGKLQFIGHAGVNRIAFQGRLSRSRKLKPGRYTLAIVATSAGKSSRAATLSFTIVR